MSDEAIKTPGDYYRADYDPYLNRFAHLLPGWWNVNEYLKIDRPFAVDWYERVAQGLKDGLASFELGPMFELWPTASLNVLQFEKTWARIDLLLDGQCAAKTLLLCGVNKTVERAALNDFNSNARLPGGRESDDWVRPYRIAHRPLAVALWMVDKNDPESTNSVTMALQAMCAAYFRLKWVG